ncbi:unnamed protein product, partial [marine sediment metagenome]
MNNMKPIPLIEYILFGGELQYLRLVRVGLPVHAEDFVLDNINRFINFVEESDLIVTKASLKNLSTLKEQLEKTTDDYKLTQADRDKLFNIMDKIDFVIRAEGQTKFTFFISEKRIDVNKLVFKIESLFAIRVFNALPDSIKYDFKESGKSIAFECPTASAFHVLRGLEGLLRFLLKKLDPQIDTSKICWGPLITNLKSLNIQELRVLLDNLDRI